MKRRWLTFLTLLQLSVIQAAASDPTTDCQVEIMILGAGQDAGAPQIGNNDDPGWKDTSLALWPTSLALIDDNSNQRFLFEATPAIGAQLQLLASQLERHPSRLGIDGIFLTHAHIGHYAGLMYLGHEAASTNRMPVYAMPRMQQFLETNGPWSQLVEFANIQLRSLEQRKAISLSPGLSVTPLLVPHRDEFSETVGYLINANDVSVLFIPDIDSWEDWQQAFNVNILDLLQSVDHAFLDATFYDDDELPGRDMTKIPHPRIHASMQLFEAVADLDTHITFIHMNHTNPVRFSDSPEHQEIKRRGFDVARRGDRICLDRNPNDS
ncbi:MAG: MBL fold metallo-hydrolase [Woeseiaceae bacterium]